MDFFALKTSSKVGRLHDIYISLLLIPLCDQYLHKHCGIQGGPKIDKQILTKIQFNWTNFSHGHDLRALDLA